MPNSSGPLGEPIAVDPLEARARRAQSLLRSGLPGRAAASLFQEELADIDDERVRSLARALHPAAPADAVMPPLPPDAPRVGIAGDEALRRSVCRAAIWCQLQRLFMLAQRSMLARANFSSRGCPSEFARWRFCAPKLLGSTCLCDEYQCLCGELCLRSCSL